MNEHSPDIQQGDFMPRIGVRGFSGAALDRALARKKITADELADAIEMSHQAVSQWKLGKAAPTPAALKKMAAVLGVAPADLTPIPADKLRLADLRFHAGFNGREAAGELAISPTLLSEVERGRRKYDPELAQRFASLYGVSLDDVTQAWERAVEDRATRIDNL
jgi:transcriptional regulator with XRE-family HTH domain